MVLQCTIEVERIDTLKTRNVKKRNNVGNKNNFIWIQHLWNVTPSYHCKHVKALSLK